MSCDLVDKRPFFTLLSLIPHKTKTPQCLTDVAGSEVSLTLRFADMVARFQRVEEAQVRLQRRLSLLESPELRFFVANTDRSWLGVQGVTAEGAVATAARAEASEEFFVDTGSSAADHAGGRIDDDQQEEQEDQQEEVRSGSDRDDEPLGGSAAGSDEEAGEADDDDAEGQGGADSDEDEAKGADDELEEEEDEEEEEEEEEEDDDEEGVVEQGVSPASPGDSHRALVQAFHCFLPRKSE